MSATPKTDALTPREREILVLIAQGDSLSIIAEKLHRSLKTIESHRLAIGRKLKASNRVELTKIALAEGLATLHDDAYPAHLGPGQELDWLTQISDAVNSVSGTRYINELTNAFSRVLGMKYSAVCLSAPQMSSIDRFTVAISERGVSLEPIYYKMDVAPVGLALADGRALIIDGLAQTYPEDPFVTQQSLCSYLGLKLNGDYGGCTGVIAVMHDQPLQNAEAIERVMRFFLARTSAELERVHKAEEIESLRRVIAMHNRSPQVAGKQHANDAGDEMSWINLPLGHLTGMRYLGELADLLCDMLGVRYAGVCVSDQVAGVDGFLTLSASEGGQPGELFRYPMSRMPCEQAYEHAFYCVPHDVIQRYPDKQFFKDLSVQSYAGIRLDGQDGKAAGVMWVMDDKPFDDPDRVERVLRFCTVRAGSEVEQLASIQELNQLRENMQAKITEQADTIRDLRLGS